jgi:hypothetical protein
MSLYKAPPVERQPEVTLIDWAVVKFPNGNNHILGLNAHTRDGRISTEIVEVLGNNIYKTRSGRVYKLLGESACNSLPSNASYVLNAWCYANRLDPKTVKNVTSEYV